MPLAMHGRAARAPSGNAAASWASTTARATRRSGAAWDSGEPDRPLLHTRAVIPTAFIAGLLVGRWWIVPVAAVAWSAFVAATGDCQGACVLGAGALAAVNAALAVAIRIAVTRRFASRA